MRQRINKYGLLIAPLLMLLVIVGCDDDVNYMESNITDMNSKIQSVDKKIAQPGDVVTFTGTELDKVYKIMLNTDNVQVAFEATSNELKMTVPAAAPLGDVITINIFFSGKGLAQRSIKIQSPPVMMAFSPSAVRPGDKVTILGGELYLAEKIFFGDIEVTTPATIVDDKTLLVTVPEGFVTSFVHMETATGARVTSPIELIRGVEFLLSDFTNNGKIVASYSAYSNSSGEVIMDEFPRENVYVITLADNGSTWGANCDFTLQKIPTGYELEKLELVVDMKASKELQVNMMIGAEHNPPPLWGLRQDITPQWKTFNVPFSSMGLGYDNTLPLVDPMYEFNKMTVVKFSLPAMESANWGSTITMDNAKIIYRD